MQPTHSLVCLSSNNVLVLFLLLIDCLIFDSAEKDCEKVVSRKLLFLLYKKLLVLF